MCHKPRLGLLNGSLRCNRPHGRHPQEASPARGSLGLPCRWLILTLQHDLLWLVQPKHQVVLPRGCWEPVAGLPCSRWLVKAEEYHKRPIGRPCQARCLQATLHCTSAWRARHLAVLAVHGCQQARRSLQHVDLIIIALGVNVHIGMQ